jgi:hypothetical protein
VDKYLRRELEGKSVIHFFGGRAGFGIRMDIDTLVRPDVIGDAWLPPFGKDSFDFVVLDPPYEPYCRMNQQMRQTLLARAAWVAKEGVIWFHTLFVDHGPGLRLRKTVSVYVGCGAQMRCLVFMDVRRPKEIDPIEYATRGPAIKYNKWVAGNVPLPFEQA